MEIIVALVILGVVGFWIYSSNKKPSAPSQLDTEIKVETVPYKVDAPVPAADVAPQPVVAVEGAGAVEVPAAKPAKAKKAPAKKPAAKKPAAPKKPAAKKAPAKKKPSA